MFRPNKELFRNSVGQLYTRRVFLETSYNLNDRSMIQYTLTDRDHPDGYVSLYRLYMEAEDPTEFRFAETYLDSFEHWKLICATEWFKPIVARWRKSLEAKIRQQIVDRVISISKDDTHKNQFEALKVMLQGSWKEKEETRKAGRPSKEEIKGHLVKEAEEDKMVQEELNRLGVN